VSETGPAPVVSVVLPLFNHGEHVCAAVASMLAQTVRESEVIVIDDGSTDGGLARLRSAFGGEERLRLATIPHSGIVPAINRGIAMARGLFIARMDADDLATPDRLQVQLEVMASNSRIGAIDCLVEIGAGPATGMGMREHVDWLNSLASWERIRAELFVESPLVHPAVVMRRAALAQAGGYLDVEGPEDYSLWLRMVRAGWQLGKAPKTCLVWRDLPGRLTRQSERYSPGRILDLKLEHLPSIHPCVREGVQVWGAGPTGRRLVRGLARSGIPLVRLFDIDPAKWGRTVSGAPVRPLDELPQHLSRMTLIALGTRKAKAQVKEWCRAKGLVEGEQVLFVS
jgi:hypothetical protein